MYDKEYWWEAEEDKIHESLFPCVKSIEESQRDIHQANLEHAKLYSNRSLSCIDWGLINSETGVNRLRPVSENVIQSVCDTATSLIAKNRPKATVSTDGAMFEHMRRAKDLDMFLFAEFERVELYDKCVEAFRDSVVFGTGVVKVFNDDGELCVERVMPDEIIVDERECISGKPLSVHHRRLVDREALKGMFPDKEDEINDAQKNTSFEWVSYRSAPSELVIVIETHRLPVGNSPGIHAICTENTTLLYEEWDHNRLPYEFLFWSKPLAGFYGQGLAEQLAGIQLRIHKINKFIDRAQDLFSQPRFLVPHGSRIRPEQITNQPGSIVYYSGLQKPEVWVGQAVGAEIFNRLDSLKRSAFEMAGISQLTAQSKKPAGLDSGAALREYNDIETERFAIQAQNYETLILRIAGLMVITAKDIYNGGESELKTTWKSKNLAKTIKWSDVDMDEDRFVLRIEPSSILSKTPAGRKQDVADLMSFGFLEKDEALALLGHPDMRIMRMRREL
jgi:hypothetical protein